MKKLLTLCLLLMSFHCHAHLLKTTKYEVINKADYHRKMAQLELREAEYLVKYIPDLSSREHMKALIVSGVGSLLLSDVRLQITTVGLALIGSMAAEQYDNYLDMKGCLTKAGYHLEMEKFYNSISLHSSKYGFSANDNGTKEFLNAIDNLTMCQMLATTIEDEDTQRIIEDIFNCQRSILLSQLNNEPSRLSKKLSDEASMFYENVEEIIAECDDELRSDLSNYTYAMVEALEAAERNWGIR